MLDYKLIINGYEPPPTDAEGYTVTENKIWSKNTGRTASGLMVGDIVSRKYSLSLTWSELDSEAAKLLDVAINTEPFFPVDFINQRGEELTRNFYSDDPKYTKKVYRRGKLYYSDYTVTLTEK